MNIESDQNLTLLKLLLLEYLYSNSLGADDSIRVIASDGEFCVLKSEKDGLYISYGNGEFDKLSELEIKDIVFSANG